MSQANYSSLSEMLHSFLTPDRSFISSLILGLKEHNGGFSSFLWPLDTRLTSSGAGQLNQQLLVSIKFAALLPQINSQQVAQVLVPTSGAAT